MLVYVLRIAFSHVYYKLVFKRIFAILHVFNDFAM